MIDEVEQVSDTNETSAELICGAVRLVKTVARIEREMAELVF